VHTINSGPAAGLKFEVTLPLDKAVWAGTYELAFASAIARTVRPGDICYDIGGYRGYMSGVFALSGASRVFVFEPLPTNQRALRRLCELNPSLSIDVLALAVGNLNGSTRLKVMPDPSMAKLADSTFQPTARPADEIEISIKKIDSLVEQRQLPGPDVVKIDVEGAELDVLLGASNTLKKHKPRIFLEVHSSELEHSCLETLLTRGYEFHRRKPTHGADGYPRHVIAFPL
jgi:FkbM family methyltransferase